MTNLLFFKIKTRHCGRREAIQNYICLLKAQSNYPDEGKNKQDLAALPLVENLENLLNI